MRPLRVPDQDDLLERTRGDLGRELGRECFGPGRRRVGVIGESGRVVDNGGGDFLGAFFDHGGDQGANDPGAGGFPGGTCGNDVHGGTGGGAGLQNRTSAGKGGEGEDGEDCLLHGVCLILSDGDGGERILLGGWYYIESNNWADEPRHLQVLANASQLMFSCSCMNWIKPRQSRPPSGRR